MENLSQPGYFVPDTQIDLLQVNKCQHFSINPIAIIYDIDIWLIIPHNLDYILFIS